MFTYTYFYMHSFTVLVPNQTLVLYWTGTVIRSVLQCWRDMSFGKWHLHGCDTGAGWINIQFSTNQAVFTLHICTNKIFLNYTHCSAWAQLLMLGNAKIGNTFCKLGLTSCEGHFLILMLSHNLGKTNSCKTVLLSVKSGLFNQDQNAMLTLLKTQTVYKNIKMTSAAQFELYPTNVIPHQYGLVWVLKTSTALLSPGTLPFEEGGMNKIWKSRWSRTIVVDSSLTSYTQENPISQVKSLTQWVAGSPTCWKIVFVTMKLLQCKEIVVLTIGHNLSIAILCPWMYTSVFFPDHTIC